jgi:hypothetical protein
MTLMDSEITRIVECEKKLEEIEKKFHKFKIEDVKSLETYLIDEGNEINQLYIRVGPYNSKARQRIIEDVKSWISKLDYKVLMRIKNTSLIRKQVTSREFNKNQWPLNRLKSEIEKIKAEGWSDSTFSLKINRSQYNQLISENDKKLIQLENEYSRVHKKNINLLNEILDVADKYESEIHKLDFEIISIKKIANERKSKENLKSKLAKAARSDGKIRSESSSYRKNIKKTELCPYCSQKIGTNPHLDHIYPVSKGGLNLDDNLVYCCKSCNSKKSDKSLRQFCKENDFNFLEVTDRLAFMGKHI